VTRNGVAIRLVPAGHVLGSAQVVLEWQGSRIVVSGDYKRRRDPSCAAFEPVPCDVFVTEATFALPVFRHPPAEQEVARLLKSVRLFPDRAHLIGVYALGKCQRLIRLLREAGWDRPIWLHGGLMALCALYEELGVTLGDLRPVPMERKRGAAAQLAGEIVLAPSGAEATPWVRRLAEPVVCAASGWMRVRQRAKAKGVELPLIVSDHADWAELLQTAEEVQAPEVWVTHGREDALCHALARSGVRGRALHLVGRGEEDEGPSPEATDAVVPAPAEGA
jgi:putative mRNA 3-end processing factor